MLGFLSHFHSVMVSMSQKSSVSQTVKSVSLVLIPDNGSRPLMTGNTAAVPNLYGQRAAYIVQQLDAFAIGNRRGTVMGSIATALSPQNRKNVVEYLSGLR